MKSITHNIASATLGRIVVNLIGLVIVGLLTRSLGPERFGEYNAIFAYLFLFATLADMGLYTLLVREISRQGADEPGITGRIFTLRLTMVLASVLAGSVIAWFLPYPVAVRVGIIIASISIVASSLVQVLMGVFQKHLALHQAAVADVVMRTLQLAGVWLVVAGDRASVLSFVLVAAGAGIVQLAATLRFARMLVPFRLAIDTTYWRMILREALPIAVSLVFVLLYFKIDIVMLSLMKPSYDVGVYSVGYKVLEAAIFFPAMYIGLIMPQLSRFASQREQFQRVFEKTFRILFITAIPSVIGIYVFAPFMVSLLGGGDFVADAAPVLRILALAVGIIFFGNLGGNAIIALGIQRTGMWIYGAGAVFNIILNFLLIPRYSYVAAAWNTVATELLVTIGMFWLIARATKRTAGRL